MPKFVSGSSGQVYAHDKRSNKDETDDVDSLLRSDQQKSTEKPSAINKKGSKEKQKNSLELFKEELKRLQEERNNPKKPEQEPAPQKTRPQTNVLLPLKPDPRCPTSLTLQVNLKSKDRDSLTSGSYDTGDPTTTNIYLGNLNPTVNENDLCDIFGKFGPLASIKIMWPRTDEERARNRNSGFVAYMSRVDAERALQALNGKEFRGYDLKLGWGKAVPMPQNPVYVPPELIKLTLPPPQSGLPFNGQMSQYDLDRGYVVPDPHPRPPPSGLESGSSSIQELESIRNAYDEFIDVFKRCTVKVVQPSDRSLLDRIHKTIEYVIKEGPVFEAIVISRENKNPLYRFLYDNRSHEHVYYRWKLYSILHGDDPYAWRTEEFRMFEDGPIWKPPPMNPYAKGMPEELIQTKVDVIGDIPIKKTPTFLEKSIDLTSIDTRIKGTLGKAKSEMLGDILRNLDPTKTKVGQAMVFCINHADAAKEIIDCIYESLKLLETPFQRKIARLFLVSDILHNCSATVTNASYYREGFQTIMISIFEHLREYLINIEDCAKASRFKQKALSVLGAWKEWKLYEDDFVLNLSNILLGFDQSIASNNPLIAHSREAAIDYTEEELDGIPLDEDELSACLESKGLSLRWYKSLDLSDEEDDNSDLDQRSIDQTPRLSEAQKAEDRVKFKSSKWEIVDPDEVAGQVITISKWDRMAKDEEDATTDSSASSSPSLGCDPSAKRFRPAKVEENE